MGRSLGLLAVLCLVGGMAEPAFAARRALLVAVADYPGRKALPGPREMQQQLRATLIKRYGFQPDEIRLLADRQATRAGIVEAIESWLIAGTGPDDTALFWYSGHGGQVPDEDGDEEDGLDECLCPYDVRESPLLDDDLGKLLARVPSRDFTVLLDCCHSGTATRTADEETVVAMYLPLPGSDPSRVEAHSPSGMGQADLPYTLITAARADQSAVAVRHSEHGNFTVFSRALLESMNAADEPLTAPRLMDSVRQRIRKWRYVPPGEGEAQEPQLEGSVAAQRPLFGFAPTPAAPPTVASPPPVAPRPAVRKLPARPLSLRLVPGGASAEAVRRNPAGPEVAATLNALGWVQPAARGASVDGVLIYSPNAGRMYLKLFSPAGGFLGQAVAERTTAAVRELTPILAREWMIKRAVGLEPPEAPIRLGLSDPRAGNPSYQIGDELRLELTANRPAHVVLLNVEAGGRLTLLLPNSYQRSPLVSPEAPCLLPEPGGLALTADEPAGPQYYLAVATTEPLELPELNLGDLDGRPFRRLDPLDGVAFLNRLAAALERRPNGYATADLLALVKLP